MQHKLIGTDGWFVARLLVTPLGPNEIVLDVEESPFSTILFVADHSFGTFREGKGKRT